jgi:DNA mismatch repair protein MutL
MSASIKILPQFIANRIAAGEVIGRPEAVVKELIENSIDAGAENISVRVKDSGKAFLQIIDDAAGMNYEDALLCFQRHSTSKISNAADLENIRTLGFRGEALASICAVSQVELKTKTANNELGTLVKNHGGEVVLCTRVQMEKGTSITVKNLFYNTPARRNFLKSEQTEFRHIYETFIRLAISHPSVSFNFVHNDEELFDLKKSDIKTRLEQVYGKEFAESLVEVSYGFPVVRLQGFTSRPSFSKKNKQDQYLFLNGRYVISKSLSYAVHLAYDDLIEKGDYPNFFLFLSLDPQKFDVNVHPSKLEVKFEDERTVFNFIKKGVRDALERNDLIIRVPLEAAQEVVIHGRETRFSEIETAHSPRFAFQKFPSSNIHELFSGKLSSLQEQEQTDEVFEIDGDDAAREIKHENVDRLIGKYGLWQFHSKYIMYQLENTLIVIDQHAAHERILYEQAVERLNSSANLSQQLLIPVYTELNQVDYELAKSLSDGLRALGFNLEFLSKRKIKINGIPSDVRLGQEDRIIQDLVDEFKENDVKLNLDKRDNLAKSFACKHAIRTGDRLTHEEMLNLIDKLFSVNMPYVCPHGRPTIIKIPIEELDKKFARTGF